MADRDSKDTLWCGSDLREAAAQSSVTHSLADTLGGFRNALAVMGEMAGARLSGRRAVRFELVTARGTLRGGNSSLTAAYVGTGVNLEWCLSTVFPDGYETTGRRIAADTELSGLLRDAASTADIAFAENIPRTSAVPESFLASPAWIKQRVRVKRDWREQVDSLHRGTRQETARILRRQGYRCRLTSDARDFAGFYDELYSPYIAGRFGAAALIVARERFIKECRRGIVMQLLLGESVIAAALLRRTGNSLAVVWTGHDPATAGAGRGATDALDYFSLLYAHLKGCRWLDFGPSRPDLLDGALRYKAKWGARIHLGLVPQSNIFWTCQGRHDSVARFLRRHVFLVRNGAGLTAAIFTDGAGDAPDLGEKLALIPHAGVRDYRVIALSPPDDRLRNAVTGIDANVTLVEASSCSGAISALKESI